MTKPAKRTLIAIAAGLLVFAVGVVAVLVGAAILGHKQALISGNEAAATLNVKSISFAQAQYSTENGNFGTFDQLVQTGLLSQKFAGALPVVDGYIYDLKVSPARPSQKSTFTLNADPESATTGNKHFFINETSSIIHVNRDRVANASDPPLIR
jgi:hypothetical protein